MASPSNVLKLPDAPTRSELTALANRPDLVGAMYIAFYSDHTMEGDLVGIAKADPILALYALRRMERKLEELIARSSPLAL